MKKILLIGVLITCFSDLYAQNHEIDSLYNKILYAENDTTRIDFMNKLAIAYQSTHTDSAFKLSMQAYNKSSKIDYLDGMSRAASIIGSIYLEVGNYPKALEFFLKKLKAEEKRNNAEILTVAIMQISTVYQSDGNYKKAAEYAFQADSIIDAQKLNRLKIISLINIGDLYEKEGNISLAMKYNEKAYSLAIKENNTTLLGTILNNHGNTFAKAKNVSIAIQFYSTAIPYLEANNDKPALAEANLGLANQYSNINNLDSAFFYGKASYNTSKGLLDKQLKACIFLTNFYKNRGDIKNAFAFQEEELILKDSIYNKDRIAKAQLLTLEEELRQKEIAEKKIEEAHDRKIKLQYLTIAIILPIFFFITIYLSNRKIRPKYIEFLGIVSLLLTFEYIMIILHPLIVSITHHLPFYQLLIFAVIASILTPLHHRIENWLIKVLTKKEKVSLMNIRIQ